MLDIRLIRESTDAVAGALSKRMDRADAEAALSKVIELDAKRRSQVVALDDMRSRRKELARAVGEARREGRQAAGPEAEASALRAETTGAETRLRELEEALRSAMYELPNIPSDEVPAGGKEANLVVRSWGEQPDLGTGALDHVELSRRLGLVDFERGAKLGGAGFWLYTGMGAALEWALLDFFCRSHIADGYEFMLPPHMLLEECGYAAGQFPKFAEDVFHVQAGPGEQQRFLLPTAETAMVNVYRDEIIPTARLPVKAFAYTPCYRREAGGYRSDERGTVRGHQFNKVELFQFVARDAGAGAHAEMVRKTERVVEDLGLHYRTSLLAARDASAAMMVTYDVEAWVPSIGAYKEVSSASYAGDYQARRANIRYRHEGEKQTSLVHTLNASALATSRLVPAILEQLQQPDGTVAVPAPLQAWLGTDVIGPPKSR
ncbi:MAG: serine--tRNA ligase [Acidimicrobiales bacterium]